MQEFIETNAGAGFVKASDLQIQNNMYNGGNYEKKIT